jgi:hypothetical protein
MGTIIGMIEPHKLAFSAEITAINGIFRKPPPQGTTNRDNHSLGQDGLD